MKRMMAAVFVAVSLGGTGTMIAFAQDIYRPLTRAENNAFEACLHTIWVNDYCGATTFVVPWATSRVRACVIANGGNRFPVPWPRPWSAEDYCRAAVMNAP
jgi:hypothetical protein